MDWTVNHAPAGIALLAGEALMRGSSPGLVYFTNVQSQQAPPIIPASSARRGGELRQGLLSDLRCTWTSRSSNQQSSSS